MSKGFLNLLIDYLLKLLLSYAAAQDSSRCLFLFLPPRALGEAEGVVGEELAGGWAATAVAIGAGRAFDPE
jgi:hypothetical protein